MKIPCLSAYINVIINPYADKVFHSIIIVIFPENANGTYRKGVRDLKRAVWTQVQEDFEFAEANGNIEFSVEKIEMVFSCAEVRRGSFEIHNLSVSNIPLSGFVYSTNLRLEILTKEFRGDQVEIEYLFDSTGLEEGDHVYGELLVITDRGEFQLKFEAVMEKVFLYSSMGQIKNLFHFANLAQTNWEEAVQLFYSKDFYELLTGNDARYRGIYRGLSTDSNNQRNVDEFLYAIRKKSRNQYKISGSRIEIKNPSAPVRKEICVSRTGWGYSRLSVWTNEDFVTFEQVEYEGRDFNNNVCSIIATIEPALLHKGRNHATVYVDYGEGVLEAEIIADMDYKDLYSSASHMFKKATAALTREYIDFRLGKVSLEAWTDRSSVLIDQMVGKEEKSIVSRLYQSHILIAKERFSDAGFILDRVEELLSQTEVTPAVYGYFLYLTTLVNRESEYVDQIAARINKMYNRENYDWRLGWLMLYLQEELCFRPEKRYQFLEEQYHNGANSPLLYAECLELMKENPSLLVKLEEFEIAVLSFAAKNRIMPESVSERVLFLAGRERSFRKKLFDILEVAYEQNPSKELLSCIISYLMKGNCGSPEYFKWFELGVMHELRITRLYEFYMDSIDLNYQGDLPKIVMMYFAYQNNLDYEHRAFLYANVLHRRVRYPEIAMSYAESVTDFVKEQILKGRINRDLIYLYQRVVNKELLQDEKVAAAYAGMLFLREIPIENPLARKVIVIHDELTTQEIFPVTDHVAYVPVYGENYHLLLEDDRTNRYVIEKPVAAKQVLWNPELLRILLDDSVEHMGLLVYMCQCESGIHGVTDKNEYWFSRLLSADEITLDYKKQILSLLVNFYFENDCIRELDELLLNVKPEALSAQDRGNFIHILVARGLYDTAFEWLTRFGTEHTSTKTVLRLASRLLERTAFEENEQMKGVCCYLYRKQKYDQNILTYLSDYFEGTTRELREIDRIMDSFGVDDYKLLERLLIQILFTGILCQDKMDYFDRYIRQNGNMTLQKAFLARIAFDYFVSDRKPEERVMHMLVNLYKDGEEINRISRLALLKFYSGKDPATWDVNFLYELLKKEISNGVCFPFFPVFAAKIPGMLKFTDLSFVEYKGRPTSRVIIHYCIEHENGMETEYRKEEMDNLYAGIFVRKFILFSGDEIKYYITEENGNREQLTQSSVLKKETGEENESKAFMNPSAPWRYSLLDRAAKEKMQGNLEACGERIYEYLQTDYLTRMMFWRDEK